MCLFKSKNRTARLTAKRHKAPFALARHFEGYRWPPSGILPQGFKFPYSDIFFLHFWGNDSI